MSERRNFGATAALAGLIIASLLSISDRANAALIGTATSSSGSLFYEGLGAQPAAPGLGTGRWAIGDCSFDGANTNCVLSGDYVEDGTSTNAPGEIGTFSLTMTYAGNGPNPAIARSNSTDPESLSFIALGDAVFTLLLNPASGGSFIGQFPAIPFANSIGFNVFPEPGSVSCSGLPAMTACSIVNVGLNPGSTYMAQADAANGGGFTFSIPDEVFMSQIPVPAALPLFLAGVVSLGLARRKRRGAK